MPMPVGLLAVGVAIGLTTVGTAVGVAIGAPLGVAVEPGVGVGSPPISPTSSVERTHRDESVVQICPTSGEVNEK
jgi:hypothetical protein